MNATPIRLTVAGAGGRMGRMILALAHDRPTFTLTSALVPGSSALVGQAVPGCAGLSYTGDTAAAVRDGDVVIDFTGPTATLALLASCRAAGKAMVIGTTGIDEAGRKAIREAARDIPIVFSPNMSRGVNAVFALAARAAALLADYDCEILEMHHARKVDAPSGTAIELGRLISEARRASLEEHAVWSRHGRTGARRPGDIGFATLRAADVVGEHTVILAAAGERVEITHRCHSRASFAAGALDAAEFVFGKPPALYGMAEVIAAAEAPAAAP